jgi:hypothetical protein
MRALSFALLLAACNPATGDSRDGWLLDPDEGALVFDLGQLGDAVVLQPYEGRVRLTDARPAAFTVVSGAFPPGLTMGEDGRVTGTADWIGDGTVRVRAVDGGGAVVTGDITVRVRGDGTVFLAAVPDQSNNFSSTGQGMTDPWVRLDGAGVSDQSSVSVTMGLFLPGPNGTPERGRGDDIQVGEVPAADVTVSMGEFVFVENGVVEDDAPTWGGGAFRAGSDTGSATFSLVHAEWGTGTGRLLVVPPDWCPAGIAWDRCE